jgi:hypothetical protein
VRWLVALALAMGCASPQELAEARKEIARLEDEVAAQKAALEKTEDELVLELVEARKTIARLEDQTAALEAALERNADEETKRLRQELHELKFWIAEYKKRYGRIGGGKGDEGVVLRVEGTTITISTGSADGVAVGDVYHMRRGSSYVGQMMITKVEKARSHGVFDTKFPGPAAPPRRADVAYPGSR